jgi:hypothetical protein
VVLLPESKTMLTLASCLGHMDTNIRLLQSNAAAKLSHVKGTTEPWAEFLVPMKVVTVFCSLEVVTFSEP